MRKILAVSALALTGLASCKKDDPVTPVTNNNMKIQYASLNENTNYLETFKGSDNKSSVDFSGQATRIAMLKEIDAYVRTATTTTVDATKLRNMYENKGGAFSDAALNSATDKTIVSKTAQSFSAANADQERQRFYGYFNALAAVSASNNMVAAKGQAGLADNKYLVNEKGHEYSQLIQKGLIGALMLDQISNIYLGTEKQAADNEAIVSGKNYTQLEHHWDEAYGYLTNNEKFPKEDPANAGKYLESYLGGYVRQVGPDEGGDPKAVYMAFLKGRAAIVNKDMTTRNEQIAYIRTSLEKAIATIAVSYLNKSKGATTDGSRFHMLSEAAGFIYSLRYAHNAKVNAATSDNLLNALMNKAGGFWDLTTNDIDAVRDQIANAVGIDKNVVVNH